MFLTYINKLCKFIIFTLYLQFEKCIFFRVDIGYFYPDSVDEETKIWLGAVGGFPEFSWSSNGRSIIPSLWYNSVPTNVANNNCIYLTFSKSINPYYGLGNSDCKEKNFALCENRIEPKKCCIKKKNVFLNVI